MGVMYDTIMQLPIFQGVDRKCMSDILARTKVEFTGYSGGDVIISGGEEPEKVMYLISGSARRIWKSEDGDTAVSEKLLPGTLMAAEYLYGLDKRVPFEVTALVDSSVFSFHKHYLLENLKSSRVLLINFINYLSTRVQRPLPDILSPGGNIFMKWLASVLVSVTDSRSVDVEITLPGNFPGKAGLGTEDIKVLSELREEGIIRIRQNKIAVLSRQLLLERAAR